MAQDKGILADRLGPTHAYADRRLDAEDFRRDLTIV